MKILKITAICLLVTSWCYAQTEWTLDKNHSKIGFSATHMGIAEVDGVFKDFDAKVTSTSDDFAGSEVEFVAQVASVDTGNERRDNHLKSADFFDAENHPELKFQGKLTKENDQYYLVGDLTMRDVTKPVKFDVKYGGRVQGMRGPVAGFKVMGEVNRFDYNLKFDRALPGGDLIVSKDIGIVCNVELGAKQEEEKKPMKPGETEKGAKSKSEGQ